MSTLDKQLVPGFIRVKELLLDGLLEGISLLATNRAIQFGDGHIILRSSDDCVLTLIKPEEATRCGIASTELRHGLSFVFLCEHNRDEVVMDRALTLVKEKIQNYKPLIG